MRRSDIYEYVLGSQRIRILIISIDAFNPHRAAYLRILPVGPPAPTAMAVTLTDADPGRGAIDASRPRPLDPASLGAHIGRLSPRTMQNVTQALRTYLGLL